MQGFGRVTEMVKHLLIINVLVFFLLQALSPDLVKIGMLHYWEHPGFQPFQLVTSFFMHTGFFHLFFNMLMLFFLGVAVEDTLGPKRFLLLYLVAGFGANILNVIFSHFQVHNLMADLTPEQVGYAMGTIPMNVDDITGKTIELAKTWNTVALGASGATYGVMFAFAALFPERQIQLLIPPIPVKAKYLVLFLATMEFLNEVQRNPTGIGHFVHLSGAVIAIVMIIFWRKRGANF